MSVPRSSRCVAKLCRKMWGDTLVDFGFACRDFDGALYGALMQVVAIQTLIVPRADCATSLMKGIRTARSSRVRHSDTSWPMRREGRRSHSLAASRDDAICGSVPVGQGQAALKYLAPYIFRVALSNRRIVKFENGKVTFRFRKSDTGSGVPALWTCSSFCGGFAACLTKRVCQSPLLWPLRSMQTVSTGSLSAAAHRRPQPAKLTIRQRPAHRIDPVCQLPATTAPRSNVASLLSLSTIAFALTRLPCGCDLPFPRSLFAYSLFSLSHAPVHLTNHTHKCLRFYHLSRYNEYAS